MLRVIIFPLSLASAVKLLTAQGPGFCQEYRNSKVYFGGQMLVDEQICFDDCLLAGGKIQHQLEKGQNGEFGLGAEDYIDQYWCEIAHEDCPALKEWRAGLYSCDVGCVASGGTIAPGSERCDHGLNNDDCRYPVTLGNGDIVCDTFCQPNSGELKDWVTKDCQWHNFDYRPAQAGFLESKP